LLGIDFYAGPPEESTGTLLDAEFSFAGVSKDTVLEFDAAHYINTLLMSQTVTTASKYVFVRLSAGDLHGCGEACDSGCMIKRTAFREPTLTLESVETASPPPLLPPPLPPSPPPATVCAAGELTTADSTCAPDYNYHQHATVSRDATTGNLIYTANARGDTIPDFSSVGYHAGGVR
jgi:hypothetical protein